MTLQHPDGGGDGGAAGLPAPGAGRGTLLDREPPGAHARRRLQQHPQEALLPLRQTPGPPPW